MTTRYRRYIIIDKSDEGTKLLHCELKWEIVFNRLDILPSFTSVVEGIEKLGTNKVI